MQNEHLPEENLVESEQLLHTPGWLDRIAHILPSHRNPKPIFYTKITIDHLQAILDRRAAAGQEPGTIHIVMEGTKGNYDKDDFTVGPTKDNHNG